MVICCWSAKGGSGCSTVAVALAARTPSLIIDLAGDVPAMVGASAARDGITEWLAAGEDVPVDALRRLSEPVADDIGVIPRGRGELDRGAVSRAAVLAQVLQATDRTVVIDCGVVPNGDAVLTEVASTLCEAADRSLLVTRSCYLAIRRAQEAPIRATGVVMLAEPGRALRRSDVEDALGWPIEARVPFDPAIARAIDAGLVLNRVPRSLRRAVASL